MLTLSLTIMTNVLPLIFRFFVPRLKRTKTDPDYGRWSPSLPPTHFVLSDNRPDSLSLQTCWFWLDFTYDVLILPPLVFGVRIGNISDFGATIGVWSLTCIKKVHVNIFTSWHPMSAEISDTTLCLQKISGGIWWCRCLCTRDIGRRGELHYSVPLGETDCKKNKIPVS